MAHFCVQISGFELRLLQALRMAEATQHYQTEEFLVLSHQQALADNALAMLKDLQQQRIRVVALLEQLATI